MLLQAAFVCVVDQNCTFTLAKASLLQVEGKVHSVLA